MELTYCKSGLSKYYVNQSCWVVNEKWFFQLRCFIHICFDMALVTKNAFYDILLSHYDVNKYIINFLLFKS